MTAPESPEPIADKLRGGDRRSIGRSEEVVGDVLAQPERFAELFAAILDEDPVIRSRAADAAEKATARRPKLLWPHKQQLLDEVAGHPQQEVRWHAALMLPRLPLAATERDRAVAILIAYLGDASRIVVVNAMQTLTELAEHDVDLRRRVHPLLERLVEIGPPAVRARGRKLLTRLDRLPG